MSIVDDTFVHLVETELNKKAEDWNTVKSISICEAILKTAKVQDVKVDDAFVHEVEVELMWEIDFAENKYITICESVLKIAKD